LLISAPLAPPSQLGYNECTDRTLIGNMRRRVRGIAAYHQMPRLRKLCRLHVIPMAASGLA